MTTSRGFMSTILCLSLTVGVSVIAQTPTDEMTELRKAAAATPAEIAATRKAAEQGSAAAQATLGSMYLYGFGVPRDPAQASVWFRHAAAQGYAVGQYRLGLLYAIGQGVLKDYAQAAAWYRKAADQGSASAQHSLGSLYKDGAGVPQDYRQALAWYRKAATQGNVTAQYALGSLYEAGTGVLQDYIEAHKWYNLAASRSADGTQGGAIGQQVYLESRDRVAQQMTPAQVAEAQKLARDWQALFERRKQ